MTAPVASCILSCVRVFVPVLCLPIHHVDGHVKRMKHFASAAGRILAAKRAERPGTYR